MSDAGAFAVGQAVYVTLPGERWPVRALVIEVGRPWEDGLPSYRVRIDEYRAGRRFGLDGRWVRGSWVREHGGR